MNESIVARCTRARFEWRSRSRIPTNMKPLLLSTLLFVLVGCGSSAESTGISASDIACPTGSTLTYASFAKDLVSSKCLACHNGKESPNLSTQSALAANKNHILSEAVYSTAMPQGNDMTHDERLKLGQWLSCGAP